MKLPTFKIANYFASCEHNTKFIMCGSDMQSFSMAEILALADPQTLKLWDKLSLGYSHSLGLPQLREEISLIYPSLTLENVSCFMGGDAAIYCVCHTLLDAKDHVITIAPCYQSLEDLPNSICETTKISLLYDHDWQLDIEMVIKAIQPHTKLLIINFPQNPTGAMIDKSTQQELLQLANQYDLWILSDEVFRGLEYKSSCLLPTMASLYAKGISLGVMSKVYGLQGIRIGWVACHDKILLEKINNLKAYLSIANSVPSEILALIALKNSQFILQRNQHIIQKNLTLLDHFFKNYSSLFSWIPPKAGCVGFPKFHGSISVDVLAEQLLQETGVIILPGMIFDYPQHFRLGFGSSNMPEALNCFEEFIDRHTSEYTQIR